MRARYTRRKLLASSLFATVLSAHPHQSNSDKHKTKTTTAMNHVVLLGDSIFDNGSYVSGGPDVVTQLRQLVPKGWQATLNAVDGAVTADVIRQLDGLPPDTTHLVVSAGGNDALGHAHVLDETAHSVAEVITRLAAIREAFHHDYEVMLNAVLRLELPTAVCTVYDGRLPDPQRRRAAVTALCIINDSISRQAFRHGLPLIDLRLICNEDDDYANPIEPSVRGGTKIAAAIASMLAQHDFTRRRSAIFLDQGQ